MQGQEFLQENAMLSTSFLSTEKSHDMSMKRLWAAGEEFITCSSYQRT